MNCPKCNRPAKFIRDRGFPDGSGKVFTCKNEACESYHLYFYPNGGGSKFRIARSHKLLELLTRRKPFEVLGVIDNYGAVHGFPKFSDASAGTIVLIHEDIFGACHKRWRYAPEKGFQVTPDTKDNEQYDLDVQEKDAVEQFLGKRGWL